MNDLYRIQPLKMMIYWVVFSLLAWPAIFMALAMITLPLLYIGSALRLESLPLFTLILGVLTVPFVGAVIGLCMAFLQRWVLRHKLYWTADRWLLWSSVGGVVGAIVVTVAFGFLDATDAFRHEQNSLAFMMMPIFLVVLSSFQVLSLRHAVKQSWLWILGNLVAGVVFAGVLIGNEPKYTHPNYNLIMMGVSLLGATSLGVITGYVMLFLFEKKLLPMQPENKDDSNGDTPKSVWDEAI